MITIDVATKAVSMISKNIDAFNESAGLHRAKNVDVFAWAMGTPP